MFSALVLLFHMKSAQIKFGPTKIWDYIWDSTVERSGMV